MTITCAAKVAGTRTAGSAAAGATSAVPERFRSISPLQPGQSVVQEQLRSQTERAAAPGKQANPAQDDSAANASAAFTATSV